MTTVARLLHTPVKSLKMGDVDQLVLHERGVVEAKRLSGMSEADTPETTVVRQPSSSSSS